MATGYEPNIEGAITVLVDLMTGNSFSMTRSPYEPNFRGLTDAIIDLKEGFPTFAPLQIGFDAVTFEAVADGDALFIRTSDGKVGKASAADGSLENATVVGFANTAAILGATVKVVVIGVKTMSGLNAGDLHFLSPSTAGAITTTAPSSSGQAVVRVGESVTTSQFAVQPEPPILLA
tara:strand:- start:1109 stop:1639 length:531 start_codon:yes stop_codon:yes gene_type:complete